MITDYVVFLYWCAHTVSLTPIIRLQSSESLIKAETRVWDDLMLNTFNKCICHLSPGFPHQNSVGLIYIKSPSTARELICSLFVQDNECSEKVKGQISRIEWFTTRDWRHGHSSSDTDTRKLGFIKTVWFQVSLSANWGLLIKTFSVATNGNLTSASLCYIKNLSIQQDCSWTPRGEDTIRTLYGFCWSSKQLETFHFPPHNLCCCLHSSYFKV